MLNNPEQTKNEIVQWIRDYFQNNLPKANAVIGISGGKDSSVTAALLVEALGVDRVVGVTMPDGAQADIADSYKLIRHLGIRHIEVNIGEITAAFLHTFAENDTFHKVTGKEGMIGEAKVNFPPRMRMSVLYAVAQSLPEGGLVTNTCNASEDYVGYSTKFGDAAGDFSPISDLTVQEVLQIGEVLGLPSELIHKTPSDGLCGLSDEDKLGFTYAELDKYIDTGICDNAEAKEKIDRLHKRNLHKLLPMPKYEKMKQELGLTNEMIASESKIPLGTVQKIFAGVTKNPRFSTLLAIENTLIRQKKGRNQAETIVEESVEYGNELHDATVPYSTDKTIIEKKQGEYTLEDYYALPDERRVELIDGVIYDMSAPTTIHQYIVFFIQNVLHTYIKRNKGLCIALASPVDVQLDMDDKTMLQPDVLVVCDRKKIIRRCICGAPDFVVEVLSPSTRKKDLTLKLSKYSGANVREYWMVDPDAKKVVVYDLEHDQLPIIYGFGDRVPVAIFDGACEVDFAEIYQDISFIYEKDDPDNMDE